jgi:tetratricopeptide (TPR) repeat protein
MKKMIVFMLMLMLFDALFAQESVWVEKAIACETAEAAEALIKEVRNNAGPQTEMCLGIIYHNLATTNPEGNAEKAVALLESAVKKTNQPLAKGFWGSALTLQASGFAVKGDFATAAALVSRGTALIDEAVTAAPGMIALRFLRAANGLGVSASSPYKRYDAVEEDLRVIETQRESLAPADLASFYLMKGELFIVRGKPDEGIKLLELAVRTAPQSPAARDARKRLALLEE